MTYRQQETASAYNMTDNNLQSMITTLPDTTGTFLNSHTQRTRQTNPLVRHIVLQLRIMATFLVCFQSAHMEYMQATNSLRASTGLTSVSHKDVDNVSDLLFTCDVQSSMCVVHGLGFPTSDEDRDEHGSS
jgi:hypothetical protein